MHQGDLLYLPYGIVACKTYRYAVTVVDVAPRYKEAECFIYKCAAEVAADLGRIYT